MCFPVGKGQLQLEPLLLQCCCPQCCAPCPSCVLLCSGRSEGSTAALPSTGLLPTRRHRAPLPSREAELLTVCRPGDANCPLGFSSRPDRLPTAASLFGSHSFGGALCSRPSRPADTSCRGFPLGSSHVGLSPVRGPQAVRRLLGSAVLLAAASHLAAGAGSRSAVRGGRGDLQLGRVPISCFARRFCSRSAPCRCVRSGHAVPDSQRFLQGGVQQLQLLQLPC